MCDPAVAIHCYTSHTHGILLVLSHKTLSVRAMQPYADVMIPRLTIRWQDKGVDIHNVFARQPAGGWSGPSRRHPIRLINQLAIRTEKVDESPIGSVRLQLSTPCQGDIQHELRQEPGDVNRSSEVYVVVRQHRSSRSPQPGRCHSVVAGDKNEGRLLVICHHGIIIAGSASFTSWSGGAQEARGTTMCQVRPIPWPDGSSTL